MYIVEINNCGVHFKKMKKMKKFKKMQKWPKQAFFWNFEKIENF